MGLMGKVQIYVCVDVCVDVFVEAAYLFYIHCLCKASNSDLLFSDS